jgi:hypothetical protein
MGQGFSHSGCIRVRLHSLLIDAAEAFESWNLSLSIALVITLALGYLRFVRRRAVAEAQRTATTAPAGDLSGPEKRVKALEERMLHAANALSS